MREAGVNLVTVGVFSWRCSSGHRGSTPGRGSTRCSTCCTPTGSRSTSRPRRGAAELAADRAPRGAPVDATERRERPGGRLGWSRHRRCSARTPCASSASRSRAVRPAPGRAAVARHNELGGGNARCFCEVSAADFRRWLGERYPDVDAANAAWGTAFWGHTYTSFDEVSPPRGSEGPEPGPRTRLRAVLVGRPVRALRRRGRSSSSTRTSRSRRTSWSARARTSSTTPGGHGTSRSRRTTTTRWWTTRTGPRTSRPPPTDARHRPRSDPVAAHGALDRRAELAAAQPCEGAR